MKTLNICYYYKPEGDMDAFNFVGECTEEGAIEYGKYAFNFTIKRDDIDGVYPVDKEEDADGHEYKITIEKIKK